MAVLAGLLPLGGVAVRGGLAVERRRLRRPAHDGARRGDPALRHPLAAYDEDVAERLPVVWQPTPATLLETRTIVHDVVASPLGSITPEAWRR